MEPCACEEARQKCTNEYCVLAPYLPANNPEVYACLSEVFDLSVVVKILKDLEPNQRQDCVDSFYFEGKARLLDPVLGCEGLLRHLQRQREDLMLGLEMDKRELKALQEAHHHNLIAQQQYYLHSIRRSRL